VIIGITSKLTGLKTVGFCSCVAYFSQQFLARYLGVRVQGSL